MTIHNSVTPQSNAIFYIKLKDESVQFKPRKAYNHITTKQVLKIVTKGTPVTTNPNKDGDVNYQITNNNPDKPDTYGFLNYFTNGLDEDSDADEHAEAVEALVAELALVTLEDISTPMTAKQADKSINDL